MDTWLLHLNDMAKMKVGKKSEVARRRDPPAGNLIENDILNDSFGG